MVISLLFWTLSLLCCGYAVFFGGSTGRWAASLFFLAVAGTMVTSGPSASWVGPNLGLMFVDLAYFVALWVLAVQSRRYWAIWCGGFQLLAFVTSVAIVLDPTASPKLYRGLESFWAIPLLLFMAGGLRLDRRAQLSDRGPERRNEPAIDPSTTRGG